MKNTFSLLLILLSTTVFTQTISTESPLVIDLGDEFEPRSMYHPENGELLIIGQQRVGSDLKAIITKVEVNGIVSATKALGTPEAADRCLDIIADTEGHTWVLVNSFEKRNILNIYKMNTDLEVQEQITIDIKNITSAISIGKISSDKIWVLATYSENTIKTYPVLIIHDRHSGNNEMIAYDYDNLSTLKERQLSDYGITEKSPKEHRAAAEAYIYESNFHLFKNANTLIDTGDGMVIVGMENTSNFGDFWAVMIDYNGLIIWEQLYEKENHPGVDALQKVIPLPNGHTFLAGTNYTKRDSKFSKNPNSNYSYNSLIVNSTGEVVHENIYDTSYHEYLNGSFLLGNHVLLSGHLNQGPDRTRFKKIKSSNLYFVLTDLEGNQIKELQIETDTYDQMVGSIKTGTKEITVLFKRSVDQENWSYYLQKVHIITDRP